MNNRAIPITDFLSGNVSPEPATAKKGAWLDEKFPSTRAGNQYLVGNQSEPSKMPTTKKESVLARTEPEPPDWTPEINELETFFTTAKLPSHPVKLKIGRAHV